MILSILTDFHFYGNIPRDLFMCFNCLYNDIFCSESPVLCNSCDFVTVPHFFLDVCEICQTSTSDTYMTSVIHRAYIYKLALKHRAVTTLSVSTSSLQSVNKMPSKHFNVKHCIK